MCKVANGSDAVTAITQLGQEYDSFMKDKSNDIGCHDWFTDCKALVSLLNSGLNLMIHYAAYTQKTIQCSSDKAVPVPRTMISAIPTSIYHDSHQMDKEIERQVEMEPNAEAGNSWV